MLRTIPLLALSLVIAAHTSAQAVEVGDTVLALWTPGNAYFIGTAVEKAEDGFLIVFEDGTAEVVAQDKVRKNDLKAGSKVLARWTDGNFYRGEIAKVVGRAFYIQYDDGDKGWAPFAWIAVKD
jgi:hypothetical protein